MLQHNNNNNYPCLDVAHKELLHSCRRNGTTFSSALGFGAIPLIKGLRAWAVSGGYSRSKRKAAASSHPCDPAHLSRLGTSHIKTHPFQTPGVRQGGLGALVTVATLKDSDGGRQTQTQCLFLKAEGCNYLCAVGTRVDRRKAGKGCQEGIGICDSKPVRKWRKSSKRPKSMENIAVVENKEATASARLDLSDKCSITKSGMTVSNNDEDQLNRSKFSASHELCEPDTCNSTTKYGFSTEVKEDTALAFLPKLNKCEVFVGPISSSECTQKTTEISKKESDPTADVNPNSVVKSQECPMPNSEEHRPEFEAVMLTNNEILSTINHSHCDTTDTFNYEMEVLADRTESGVSKELELVSKILSKDINETNETLLFISHSHCELNVLAPAISNHSDETLLTVTEEEQKIEKRIDNMDTGEPQKSMSSVFNQDMNHLSESAEDHWGSTTCLSYHNQEIIMDVKMISKDRKEEKNTNEDIEMFANSLSQRSDSYKVANAITSSPNPTPTTNATALRSISRQQQEENEGMRLALKPELELLKKQDRVQEEDNVVDKESEVVDKEDEDEFGVFLKAGDEQVWNEGFNELKKGPCEKHAGIDIRNSSLSNNPPSWMSDQSREPSNTQSEDTWTAFTQEVVSRATEKDCWFSTAVENMHLTDSSSITVPNGFFEASPCVKSTGENSDYIPTLTELLKGSAAENRPEKKGIIQDPEPILHTLGVRSQNLLDKLQDLDRMIGVKYKVAESLSGKLLLQSLNLRTLNPERASGRKQNIARFSPNLPTSNQQLAANAKRRLSYDINRNIKS